MARLDKIKNLILVIVLALVSFALYANSLSGEFLIDDQTGIVNNPRIHDLKGYFSKYLSIRPGVLWEIAEAFNWHISGDNPYYFHLFNVLTHTACVILLFFFCHLLFKNIALSFLSSLIFALHPIHTEAVSWISAGAYPLSTLFFLAALIFYLASWRSVFFLLLLTLSFTFCFLVGNTVVTLPLVLLLLEPLFCQQDERFRNFKKLRLFILVCLIILAIGFLGINFFSRNRFMHTIFYFRGHSYLIVVAKALVYYLKILYLPIQRGLYHPFGYNTADIQKISPVFFFSLGIILLAIVLFFKCRRKYLPISFAVAFFFITFLPYSNIIPVCNIISERYLYLPSAGFCIFIAYLFLEIWRVINQNKIRKKIFRAIALAAITLYLGSYAIITLKHNYEYSNLITYWKTNINNFPDGYMAYNNLAGTYYTMGDKEQAIAYCWVNLMINPNQAHVWCNLGKVYREKGDFKEALFCYGQALALDKDYPPALKAVSEIKALTEKKAKK